MLGEPGDGARGRENAGTVTRAAVATGHSAVGDGHRRGRRQRHTRDGDGLTRDVDAADARCRAAHGVGGGGSAPAGGHRDAHHTVVHRAGRGGVGEGHALTRRRIGDARRGGGQGAASVGRVDADGRRTRQTGEGAGRAGQLFGLPRLSTGARRHCRTRNEAEVRSVRDVHRLRRTQRDPGNGDGLTGHRDGTRGGGHVSRGDSRGGRRRPSVGHRDTEFTVHQSRTRCGVGEVHALARRTGRHGTRRRRDGADAVGEEVHRGRDTQSPVVGDNGVRSRDRGAARRRGARPVRADRERRGGGDVGERRVGGVEGTHREGLGTAHVECGRRRRDAQMIDRGRRYRIGTDGVGTRREHGPRHAGAREHDDEQRGHQEGLGDEATRTYARRHQCPSSTGAPRRPVTWHHTGDPRYRWRWTRC